MSFFISFSVCYLPNSQAFDHQPKAPTRQIASAHRLSFSYTWQRSKASRGSGRNVQALPFHCAFFCCKNYSTSWFCLIEKKQKTGSEKNNTRFFRRKFIDAAGLLFSINPQAPPCLLPQSCPSCSMCDFLYCFVAPFALWALA